MDINTATQLSNEFESALAKTLPDLKQVLQQYNVSEALTIRLKRVFQCTYNNGIVECARQTIMEPVPEVPSYGDSPSLDSEAAQQFWTNIASKLSEVIALLSESVKPTDESLEVHLCIDPAKLDNSGKMFFPCAWNNNTGTFVCEPLIA